MFYGKSFQYRDIPSETFGLFITELTQSGIEQSMGSGSMELYSRKIYRRATPYFYGGTNSDNLKFDVTFTSPNEIDAEKSKIIQRWLFSKRTYDKLFIVQPDMENSYFNCIMNNPQVIRNGNMIIGYSATIDCDAPFAWNYPRTNSYTYTDQVIDSTIEFYNSSDDEGNYLYPTFNIGINNFGGYATITNLSESNRQTSITGLSAGETLTMNSSLQTILSSTGLKRMSTFNKKFPRMIPGLNRIRLQGNIESIDLIYQFVSKV